MDGEGSLPLPGETLDELRGLGLRLLQARQGYRFSLDPVLLCGFLAGRPAPRAVDLGCGAGIVPLILAARGTAERVVGIERQPSLAGRARRNVRLNRLQERIDILEADLRDIRGLLSPASADLVLANPPYRPAGAGRRPPDPERAAARHELAGGLADFVAAARWLLGAGGRCGMVLPAGRLAEALGLLQGAGLEPKRLRCVHSRSGEPARLVLVEGVCGGRTGLVIEPPLTVYAGQGYTGEVLAWYGEEREEAGPR